MFNESTFKIKDYIVDRKRIGKGSFSTIYKCKNQYNKTFALKEITIDKTKNKICIKREFEIMRKLNHDNIVKIHDVIIDTQFNNIYFIMDYYEYGDLSQFLNKKPLKEKFSRKYIKQLSNGLSYLLEHNILHRDLKPQNILLTKNYDIKLTDFGFATHYTKDSIINTLCGSPMYMAPEIITRNGYDHKSDLWSVGIILYEMIHGYTPFDVQNFIDLIKEIKKKDIKIKVKVSYECRDLIHKLCKTNPNERISWEQFFCHEWFENDEILTNENNLLDIDFNSSISNINNYNGNEKQFCSFIHKSIVSNEEKLEFNFLEHSSDISDNDENSDYMSAEEDTPENNLLEDNPENNLEDNLEDNPEDNPENNLEDYLEDFLEDNPEDNLEDNPENNIEDNLEDNPEDNNLYKQNIKPTKPINIPSKPINILSKPININSTYSYIEIEDPEILQKNNKDYIVINPYDLNTISLPNNIFNKKSLTNSFREYLYSSIKIIKSSYDYISNNSI